MSKNLAFKREDVEGQLEYTIKEIARLRKKEAKLRSLQKILDLQEEVDGKEKEAEILNRSERRAKYKKETTHAEKVANNKKIKMEPDYNFKFNTNFNIYNKPKEKAKRAKRAYWKGVREDDRNHGEY